MSRRDPPEIRQQRGSPQPTEGRCGAKLALTDPPRYCLMRPARGNKVAQGGNGKCGRFGHNSGMNQRGIDNHNFKDGTSSRYAFLNPKVTQTHAVLMADEKLLDLTDDVAWLELLKGDQLRDMEVGASAAGWLAASKAWAEFRQASAARHKNAAQAAAQRLDEAFSLHAGRAAAREEVQRTLERKAKLVKARQQVLLDSEDLIPLKRVATVMAGIAAVVREFIPEEAMRLEFTRRFAGFIGRRLKPRDETVGGSHGVAVL